MRKKILSVVIMLGMVLALAGCGSTESNASGSGNTSESGASVSEKPSESNASESEKPSESNASESEKPSESESKAESEKPSESESKPASEKPSESESVSETESEEPWPTMKSVRGKKRKEILAVNVFITGSKGIPGGQNVYFNGNCDNEYFKGEILPGAYDKQIFNPGSQQAIYTLEGTDCDGNACKINVENRSVEGGYIPKIQTDSPALSFLNEGPLVAEIQYVEAGLIIHIYFCE